MNPPCLLFEDDHLLVVNKPAGLNTHSPSPFAGEGLYEWLRHREPRWANLAIIHRLDKETSGVLVFGKTPLANRSLTEQFAGRSVKKRYLALTNRPLPDGRVVVKSSLVRLGDRYVSRTITAGADVAQTTFAPLRQPPAPGPGHWFQAEPLTGRTHQIRVHAADRGFPILGDVRYGGSPWPRVCLHAAELSFQHPLSREQVVFSAPADFLTEPWLVLRKALIEPESTTAFRLVHGAADGWPGWYVDRLGPYLLSQSAQPLGADQRAKLSQWIELGTARGAYHKELSPPAPQARPAESSPCLVLGTPAPERFTVRENGLEFELSFAEGYSVGLFLDQRDNRRRLLTGHIAAGFVLPAPSPTQVLNTFAYTCGFSVCAARNSARTTSVDLSKKYLGWGQRNFGLNQLPPAEHDFLFGDTFDWLRRLNKKGKAFDLILLDPPTFSRSRESGAFRTETDYGKLVTASLPLLRPAGVLFASCNTARWPAESFLDMVHRALKKAGGRVLQEHYFPQPPDFPVSREEPAYLKSCWLRVE